MTDYGSGSLRERVAALEEGLAELVKAVSRNVVAAHRLNRDVITVEEYDATSRAMLEATEQGAGLLVAAPSDAEMREQSAVGSPHAEPYKAAALPAEVGE